MPSKGVLGEGYKLVAACTGDKATQLRAVLKDEFEPAGADLEHVSPGGWSPLCPELQRCATPAGRRATTNPWHAVSQSYLRVWLTQADISETHLLRLKRRGREQTDA